MGVEMEPCMGFVELLQDSRKEKKYLELLYIFTFPDLGFSFYGEWIGRLLLEAAVLKSVILMSESFVSVFIILFYFFSVFIILNCGSVPWSSDLSFGDTAALTMAHICSTQAVFRVHPQTDVYSECWSHPLTETLTVPTGWLCGTDRIKFSQIISSPSSFELGHADGVTSTGSSSFPVEENA